MEESEWRRIHDPHLIVATGVRSYGERPLEHAPEGYPAYWLDCPCGQSLLTSRK
jgi:hypothetical protein